MMSDLQHPLTGDLVVVDSRTGRIVGNAGERLFVSGPVGGRLLVQMPGEQSWRKLRLVEPEDA